MFPEVLTIQAVSASAVSACDEENHIAEFVNMIYFRHFQTSIKF